MFKFCAKLIFLNNLILVDFLIYFCFKKSWALIIRCNVSDSSRALVPVEKKLPSLRRNKRKKSDAFALVEKDVFLRDRAMVRRYLPDILGKVLARIWIDVDFHDLFSDNPQGTLEENGVHLPENMYLEFQKPDADRPRIVVYEQKPNSKFKVRVFYLQLVMMAGK